MKFCPACRSQYTDATLRFCLQDGAILQDEEVKQSAVETVAFSQPVTAGNILKTEELNLYAPKKDAEKTRAWRPDPPKSALRREEAKNTKSSGKIWLAVFGVLLVVAAGAGFGGWLYLQNQNKRAAESVKPADDSSPEIAQNTPAANNSSSNVVLDELNGQTNSNSSSGAEDVKREIAAIIELWKKSAEAKKLPDFLSRYAEKVDYFDKSGASLADVRADAQKIFDAYSEIEITLTNLRVAVDADGTQATAVFDKEWSYETDKDLLESKAHTKLRFQKIGGEWKITGEKYQKIYYMEN